MVDPGIQSHPRNPHTIPPAAPDGIGASSLLLTKHHGLGNDFLVVLAPEWEPSSDQARRWCHRRTGIGADGLIVAQPVDGSTTHWAMVLWNADGSRAEISGNGIRCLGQAVVQRLLGSPVPDDPADPGIHGPVALVVETDAGSRQLVVQPVPGSTWQVRASMGRARPAPGADGRWADAGVSVIAEAGVDLGNPHVVGFVATADDLEAVDMAVAGPRVEAGHSDGVNVHVVHVTDDGDIRMKVWERGVGVTQACGSGACAAAWAANRAGMVGAKTAVTMPGGSATVELDGDEIFLSGPAGYIGSVILG